MPKTRTLSRFAKAALSLEVLLGVGALSGGGALRVGSRGQIIPLPPVGTNLERLAAGVKEPTAISASALLPAAFRKRRWVTRPRPGVGRMASAWLIRRFVDPKATFGFAERPADSDVPFDMYTGELSHQGTSCTFETLAQRFNIGDVAVARIAQIVHDLDNQDGGPSDGKTRTSDYREARPNDVG
jgi:Chromate resistance exported protein